MSKRSATRGGFARHLVRVFAGESVTGFSEAELLQRFLTRRDEAAFEALVERHGPMVYAVCQRLLSRDLHAVEDAFQATFLVLVRRGRSIRDPSRLGPWLYGVAHRVARRSRSDTARRNACERGEVEMEFHRARENPEETHAVELHEELNRLPRAYRDVIVMCDLEGYTHEETARLLAWRLGTVKGRLTRARANLRHRLERRGVVLSTAAVSALLSCDVSAAVHAFLTGATLRAAAGFVNSTTTGAGEVSATASELADGVTRSMTISKLGAIAASVLVAGAVTTVGALVAKTGTPRQDSNQSKVKAQADADQKEFVSQGAGHQEGASIAELRALLKAAQVDFLMQRYEGTVNQVLNTLPACRVDLFEAVRDASVAIVRVEGSTVNAAKSHLKRMVDFKERAKATEERWMRVHSPVPDGSKENEMRPMQLQSLPLTELQLAEARLWVGESEAGQPLTGIAAAGLPIGVAESDTPAATLKDPKTLAILKALDQPLALRFQDSIPIGDFVKFVRGATKCDELPNGLPFYIPPDALLAAGQTLESPITIDLEDTALKTSLRLALGPLELHYMVKDGLVIIADSSWFGYDDDKIGVIGDPPVPGYGSVPTNGFPRLKSK